MRSSRHAFVLPRMEAVWRNSSLLNEQQSYPFEGGMPPVSARGGNGGRVDVVGALFEAAGRRVATRGGRNGGGREGATFAVALTAKTPNGSSSESAV